MALGESAMAPSAGSANGTGAGEVRLAMPRPAQLSQWERLAELRRRGALCDVTVRCAGDEALPAHAVVLATASDPLRRHFEQRAADGHAAGGGTAAGAAGLGEVAVPASAEAVRAALDFVYTGAASVRPRAVAGLVRVARRWELSALQDALSSAMEGGLTPEIVAGLFALGEPFGEHLGAAARLVALAQLGACAATEAFGRWKPNFLEHVLRSDDLVLGCEEEALTYLVRWCAAAEGRDSDVFPLFAIRWNLMSLPTLDALSQCKGPPGSLRAAVADKCAEARAVHQGLDRAAKPSLRKAYAGWWAGLGCATSGVAVVAGQGAAGKAGAEELAPRVIRPHEGTLLFLDGRKEPGRVLQWFLRAQSGRSIAGQGSDAVGEGTDFEDIADVWSGPGDAVLALDRDAERVVRVRHGEGEVVGTGGFKLRSPCAVAAGADRGVFVLDSGGARVVRIVDGRGAVVAGAADAGTGAGRLDAGPTGRLFVSGGRIYVADTGNHRVQRWEPGAKEGVTVAGGHGCGAGANQLNHPGGIWVQGNGTLFVADTGNHRVVKWRDGATAGVLVAGGCGPGGALHQLREPVDVAIEPATQALLIADFGNRRVVRWAAPPPPGELVSALRK